MRKILITGGTVFVSKYITQYFVQGGNEVYVLNRNHHPQVEGVHLIECDRNQIRDALRGYEFDVIIDVNAYTKCEVEHLVKALDTIHQYIFISSSAIYPDTSPQPFREEQPGGVNQYWGTYGTDKYEAELYLQEHVKQCYILRPPYLYGPMQNIYREPFVFDCAKGNRPFFVPKDGSLQLQFFHIDDLCRFIKILIETQPDTHVFNVGNPESVSIVDWVTLCYQILGKNVNLISVDTTHKQRDYFCFSDYSYQLDVSKQMELMKETKPLLEGLTESYAWYSGHEEHVEKRPYVHYIDTNFL